MLVQDLLDKLSLRCPGAKEEHYHVLRYVVELYATAGRKLDAWWNEGLIWGTVDLPVATSKGSAALVGEVNSDLRSIPLGVIRVTSSRRNDVSELPPTNHIFRFILALCGGILLFLSLLRAFPLVRSECPKLRPGLGDSHHLPLSPLHEAGHESVTERAREFLHVLRAGLQRRESFIPHAGVEIDSAARHWSGGLGKRRRCFRRDLGGVFQGIGQFRRHSCGDVPTAGIMLCCMSDCQYRAQRGTQSVSTSRLFGTVQTTRRSKYNGPKATTAKGN
mmetsp:Transcript_19458/g.36425  ORF Transcript_19458/g.36425 Transcript_19458/m.36425 type:complete len:276 (+) Transcript_19458:635-1462(+)